MNIFCFNFTKFNIKFQLAFVARTCKINIAIISEDGKIIQTRMKHFLLLLLRNATKHNSIKFSAARLHVSSDKFWNCLKDLKCNKVKNSCLLLNKRTLRSTKLKKNICETFYRLQNVKNSERSPRNQLISYDARNACRMSDTGTSPCISFFSTHPTSVKWIVSWTVGNRLLKPLCSKMLDWLNFLLGEIIGLIHALEKKDIIKIKHSCVIALVQYMM